MREIAFQVRENAKKMIRRREERNTRKQKKGGKGYGASERVVVVAVPKAFYKVIWMGLVGER
jgi:hypothetical protein